MKQLLSLFVTATLLACLPATAEEVSPQTIAEQWTSYGQGAVRHQNGMLFLQEAEPSKGVGVVSPEPYGDHVVLRYELMPLNPASVCVAVLSASDDGQGHALTLPDDYDGGIAFWTRKTHNYFFAFHNMAHDRTPFVLRSAGGGLLAEHDANVMQAGVFCTVEISRQGDTLALSIDGQRLFEAQDPTPLAGGHLGFRLRGINGIPAACFIRHVTITTPHPAAEAPADESAE